MASDDGQILMAVLDGAEVDQVIAQEVIQRTLQSAEKEVDDHEEIFMAWAAKFRLAGKISVYESARDKYSVEGNLEELMSEDELGFWLMQEVQRACEQGFDLFFSDYQVGGLGEKAIQAFQKIGAKKHAKLFEKVLKLYGDRPTGNQETVLDAFEEMPGRIADKIEALEGKMFDLRFWSLYGFEWDWQQQTG